MEQSYLHPTSLRMSASVFSTQAPRVAGTGCYQPPGKLVSKHSQSERAAELSHGCPPAALSARILGKVISGADKNLSCAAASPKNSIKHDVPSRF